ncbi:MAG: DUF481 domain-containing protein [Pseudomonadota bacterium]
MPTRFDLVIVTTSAFLITPFAFADDPSWAGDGSVSASMSTGNTETTDVGIAVKLDRDSGVWNVGLDAAADYGETEGVETKNRLFFGTNLDRQITDRMFGFGSVSWESDDFSGFESRTFVGGGLGYEIFAQEGLGWVVRGGPGFKVDEIEAILDSTVTPIMVIEPGRTEESISAIAESEFLFDFNDNVGFTNNSKALYAETSTQFNNVAALQAALTETLSARLSFEARYDTEPPEGFESTDTITRFSVVYNFGQ